MFNLKFVAIKKYTFFIFKKFPFFPTRKSIKQPRIYVFNTKERNLLIRHTIGGQLYIIKYNKVKYLCDNISHLTQTPPVWYKDDHQHRDSHPSLLDFIRHPDDEFRAKHFTRVRCSLLLFSWTMVFICGMTVDIRWQFCNDYEDILRFINFVLYFCFLLLISLLFNLKIFYFYLIGIKELDNF